MYKFIFIFQGIHLGPQKHFSLSPHFFTNTDSFNPHTNPINGALHYPHLTNEEMVETLSNLRKATQRGSQDSNPGSLAPLHLVYYTLLPHAFYI